MYLWVLLGNFALHYPSVRFYVKKINIADLLFVLFKPLKYLFILTVNGVILISQSLLLE